MSNSTVHPDSFPSSRVASEGSSVLLDVNDGDRLVFSRLTSGATLKIGNQNFSLKPLIGCPFGTLLQVENGAEGPFLSPVTPSEGENSVQEKGECEITDESRDNRGLVDDNKAQTLTGDDIDEMRRQGAKGDEIIEALIANSATFGKKTSFSQEKYRLKKQKKYAPRVLLRRPFTRSICEAYFKKYPTRIGFLRVDTLSLLLSLANIGGNSDVLVVDMVGGLVTGAVAERLGGTGCVCNTYLGSAPYSMEIVRIFNFNDEICKRIVRTSLDDLCSAQPESSEQVDKHESENHMELHDKTSAINMEDISLSSDHEVVDARTETTAKTIKINKTPKHGEKPSHETFKLWKEQGFSSLIIAAPDLDPWSAVKRLLPLLSYSAPFAIYHQYLQPLATCMHNLQAEKMAIGLQLSEPWVREYQVLPSRTHPFMQMNASGGYVLSGTRISTAANDGLRS
ncbi:tRNA (adenine(58)-N(1))-methyltransferase non-catalytic subunit trm6 [Linum perenne]